MNAKYLPYLINKELMDLKEELYEHKLKDIEPIINRTLKKYIGRDVVFEVDEGFSDPWYVKYYGKLTNMYAEMDIYNGIKVYAEIESYRLCSFENESLEFAEKYIDNILKNALIEVDIAKYKRRNVLRIRKNEFSEFKKQMEKTEVKPVNLEVLLFPSLKIHKEHNKKKMEYPHGLGIIDNLYVL